VDNELLSKQIQIERKQFSFAVRENIRGRFLKITEDVGGRRDTIIIPSTGLEQVRDIIDDAIEADREAGPYEVSDDT
jgi:hypothetical protein